MLSSPTSVSDSHRWSTSQRGELLPIERELHGHRAPRCAGTSLAVARDAPNPRLAGPAELRKHRDVALGCLLRLRVEPQERGDRLHRSPPQLVNPSGGASIDLADSANGPSVGTGAPSMKHSRDPVSTIAALPPNIAIRCFMPPPPSRRPFGATSHPTVGAGRAFSI